MKTINFYFLLIWLTCSFSELAAQSAPPAGKAEKYAVIDLENENYKIQLDRYGDGLQNLSWETGEKLFGMGGSLKSILKKLFDQYQWKIANKWSGENYYLRINYKNGSQDKEEVNKLFLEALATELESTLEKSRVELDALCLTLPEGDFSMQKAQNRNVMNQISKVGNSLMINSVKLKDLPRLLEMNSEYRIQLKSQKVSSNRYDFKFNIRSQKSLAKDLEEYGFEVSECSVEKVLITMR